MATYERAVVAEADYLPVAALELYNWNAQVSGAFMAPLHICELVVRNAVSDALTIVYGALWPWSPVFAASLPALLVTIHAEIYRAFERLIRRLVRSFQN